MHDRFSQVRKNLSIIKDLESKEIPPLDADEVKIFRGLFFVHLYGAFEKSINEAVEQFLMEVDGLNVQFLDFSVGFLPTALDPIFTSLKSSGKWDSRIGFFKKIESADVCRVSNSVFSDQLQNTWFSTLEKIASYIGINDVFLKNINDSHYLNEVVEKRNQVAHGRNSPLNVGSSGRSSDLEARFDALNRILDDYIEVLEEHCNSLHFIKDARRSDYAPN